MPTTNVNWESVNAFAGTVRVYTRQFWADSWTLVDNLWPTAINWNLLPDTPVASFRSDYGPVLPTADDVWVTVAKVNVLGYYVRVEVDCADGTLVWVGFIDDVVDYQGGITNNGVSDVPYGRLEITAYAMSHCLNYETVLNSYWWDGSAKRQSGSAIGFNIPGANRTNTVPSGQASHLFSDADNAQLWSARDIAQYLIAQHAPKNAGGSTAIPFTLLNASLIPDWDFPEIDPDRMTVAEILEQVIDRRLFLAAGIGYDLGTNTNQLAIHSLSPTSVTLGGGRTLAASSNFLTIACWADQATTAIVRSTATSIWHEVRARGGKRTSTATLTDGVGLDHAWDSTDVTAFNAAASADAGYSAATIEVQRARNAAKRSKYPDIFSRLFIPADYDFDNGNPIFQTDAGARHYAFPGAVSILPELPLQTRVDYAGGLIAAGTVDYSDAGSDRPPFMIVDDPRDITKSIDVAERFGIFIEPPSTSRVGNGKRTTDIRIISTDEAIVLGGTEYTALPADPVPDEVYDLLSINATVCLSDDRYAEAIEVSSLAATADQVRRIAIDCGQKWKRDWVVDDTIVGLDGDRLPERVTTAAFVNDDSAKLASYAKMLGLWYLVPRNLLTIQSARPSASVFVGQLCTTLNAGTPQAVTINTIVTGISLDLPIGTERAGVPQYTLQTAATLFDPSII
jgi:hypothetical protein